MEAGSDRWINAGSDRKNAALRIGPLLDDNPIAMLLSRRPSARSRLKETHPPAGTDDRVA